MKYTLLDMTQDVLSSMDSDEVNSINDSTEAMQVARVIRSSYFDIANTDLPDNTTLFQLNSSADSTKPVVMTRPDDVHNLIFIKYDKQAVGATTQLFTILTPLTVQDFFRKTQTLSLDDSVVASMNYSIGDDNFEFLYRTDKAPDYYTVIDDHTFFFDSLDIEVDSILQKNKTFCLGEKEKTFLLEDNYIIDLDEQQHVWLLNEAKALAFQELKQMTHQKAEQTAKRQRVKAQSQKYVHNNPWDNYNFMPGYGRKGNTSTKPLIMH